MRKKIFIIGSIVLSIIIISILFLVIFFNPYFGSEKNTSFSQYSLDATFTKEQAIKDFEFMKRKYESVSYAGLNGLPAEFTEIYEREIKNMPETPTLLYIWQAASRITHTLNDGHSLVYCSFDEPSFSIPCSMKDSDFYILISEKEYKVTAVNGVDIETLKLNSYNQTSYENDIYRDWQYLIHLINKKSRLRFLGSPDFKNCIITYDDNGVLKTAEYVPLSEPLQDVSTQNEAASELDFVAYTINNDNKTAVLKLDSCIYNDHYKEVLNNFFTDVKKNAIKNIAVDLRNNGGGNSMVVNEFIRYLNVDTYKNYSSNIRINSFNINNDGNIKNQKINDLTFNGNVYILTSPSTFSSATIFSVICQDNGLAKVIGEPSGNKPTAYGDTIVFQMPYSGAYFVTTYKYFERPDSTLNNEPYQQPDYNVPYQSAEEKFIELSK